MTKEQKENYLIEAKDVLSKKQSAVKTATELIPGEVLKLKELQNGSAADKITHTKMTSIYRKRYDELQNLYPSPYFYYCLVKFDGEKDLRELYFAKFAFDQELIYSWTSPVSQIRFESPGRFTFESLAGSQSGEIIKKDQYLIADGKILFLATESQGHDRELIYQEYFSTRKTTFVLPEIVAQMEKAQDQVVRADYGGSLVVTGPAGSGKTTLALHRVAYLLQSPETADKLAAKDVIVFVQDDSTRDYFSHLLPELGIKDVEITTLLSWAKGVLPLSGWSIKEQEKDADAPYVWAKIKALKALKEITWNLDWFSVLKEAYGDFFDEDFRAKLDEQKKKKNLDRIDLAVLLKAMTQETGGFNVEKEYYNIVESTKELKRKKGKFKADYKLMIIDEFQNYLPEQLSLFAQAINGDSGEAVYIGDLNQRVRLGTISDLSELGQEIGSDRMVRLQKVYRNTKEILSYVKSLGYEVVVPDMIKSGPAVEDLVLTEVEGLVFVESKIKELKDVSVGILSHNEALLKVYGQRFLNQENVKVMPLIDSQGVEFDTVFLVGVDDDLLSADKLSSELQVEALKIKRDLLYIALTRAMNGLYVLGRKKLSEVLSWKI